MNIVEYKNNLNNMVTAGEFALPDNIPADAFRNAAIVAYTDNPKIANCVPETIFKSLRKLASLGLVPDGQEAALVPFKSKVNGQFVDVCKEMPMVYGLIKRARNSGEIRDIRAHIVYQNEFDQERFVYKTGDVEVLEHDPIVFGDRGPAIGCYAIGVLKDGSIIREMMDAADIDKVRRAGSSQKIFEKGKPPVVSDVPIGIWADWSDEMWKKTVIRRLTKRLPLTSEDRRTINRFDDDEYPEMHDVTPQRESLEDRIAKRDEEKEPTATPKEPIDDQHGDEPVQDTEPVEEAVVVDQPAEDDAQPGFASFDAEPENGFPGDPAWSEGIDAYNRGDLLGSNPYRSTTKKRDKDKADSWAGGWKSAKKTPPKSIKGE